MIKSIFKESFCDKINRLRHDLDSHVLPNSGDVTNEPRCDCSFTDFKPVTAESLTRIIHSMKSKSCSLDPMPTHLLKLCLPEIVDHLVNIVNKSFSSGTIPNSFKTG